MSGILQGLIGSLKSAASSTTDAFFNLVTLLLNTTATNGAQNNTFLDSSSSPITLTTNGTPAQGTFTPFSQTGWGTYFTGTSTRLTYPGNSSTYVSGTGDFTIEAWINLDAASAGRSRMLFSSDTANALNVRIGQGNLSSVNGLSVGRNFNSDNENCSFTWQFNTWYHVAIVRASAVYYFFVNGVQQTTLGSGTSTYSFATATTVAIGDAPSFPNDEIYKGYISNTRVSNVARYTSNFTPSTTPLTALSGTQFLSLQNNRWIDNSTNSSTITTSGTPSVQAFSPFLPTAAYDAAVVGGSGYFVSATDYLALTANSVNVGSSDFSLEAWIYVVNRSSTYYVFGGQSDRATLNGSSYNFHLTNSNGYLSTELYIGNSSANFVSTSAPPLNAWSHVVFARTGGTASMFLNGIQVATITSLGTSAINNGSTTYLPAIASNATGNAATFTGYMSNLRFIIGSGGYNATSSTITVPTALVTNSANTKLLANFTNSGIFDSAAKNNLQTVGNAQVSTTQAKWGTTSMAFDGTGDTLNSSPSQVLSLGSGNWTIECWVRLNATGTETNIGQSKNYYTAGFNGNFVFRVGTSNLWRSFDGQSSQATIDGSFSWSTGVWYHVAWVRNSGTVTVYKDGTSLGSVSDSKTLSDSANGIILGSSLNAYIDDLRITVGLARYTTTFTPPTAAFPLN
jgi:hypothetical protein